MQSLATNQEYFFRMYDRPTMNELIDLKGKSTKVRLIDRINGDYYKLGTYLMMIICTENY